MVIYSCKFNVQMSREPESGLKKLKKVLAWIASKGISVDLVLSDYITGIVESTNLARKEGLR